MPGDGAGPGLEITHLSVGFRRGGTVIQAVDDVSFSVAPGETMGLVGESGSGKSTIGRAILRLLPRADTLSAGTVHYDGADLDTLSPVEMRRMRGRLQMIFQDPLSSFNPRRNVQDIVAEGLVIQNWPAAERSARVADALTAVALDLDAVAGRKPHQFSGGQCQRIAIARALAVEPELIVCDEPVASLDVSVQAQVINLLQDLRTRRGLALIFISHDLAVVRNVSDRVAVLYMGRIVEIGTNAQIYDRPAHPYTRTLLEAVPSIAAGRMIPPEARRATSPSRNRPDTGCAFRGRCARADQRCADLVPLLSQAAGGQSVACHHPHHEPAPGLTWVRSADA